MSGGRGKCVPRHSDLLGGRFGTAFVDAAPPPPPRLVIPVLFGNLLEGEAYGAETWADSCPPPALDVPSYTSLDMKLSWRPSPRIEIAAVGQNLLEPQHREFGAIEVQRSAYGQISLRW